MIPIQKFYDILYGPQVVNNVRVEALSSNPDINTFRGHELNFRESLTEIANRKKEIYQLEPTRILQSIRNNSNGLEPREDFVNSLFETVVCETNVAPFAIFKDSSREAPIKILVDEVEFVVRNLKIEDLSANYHLEKKNHTANRSMETMRLIAKDDANDVLGLKNVVTNNLLKGQNNEELAKTSVHTIVETFTEILSYNDLIPLSALIEICNISSGATHVVHACMQHRIMIVVGIPLGFQAFHYLAKGDNFRCLLISLKKNIELVKINFNMRIKMYSYKNPATTFVSAVGAMTLTAFTGLKFGGIFGSIMSTAAANPKQVSVATSTGENLLRSIGEFAGSCSGVLSSGFLTKFFATHAERIQTGITNSKVDSTKTIGDFISNVNKKIK